MHKRNIIYFILFIVAIIIIHNYQENFINTDFTKHSYDRVFKNKVFKPNIISNQFDILNVEKIKPILTNNTTFTNASTPIKHILYKKTIYKLLGTATNTYYDQIFYLFEHQIKNKELKYLQNDQHYEYLLVKMNNDTPYLIHYINPRTKINKGDIVYFKVSSTLTLEPKLFQKETNISKLHVKSTMMNLGPLVIDIL